MILYENGASVGTPGGPNCGMEVTGSQKTEIGRNNGKATPDGYFDGQIDEVRVSKIVRTANWINASYTSTLDALSTYNQSETYAVGLLDATNVEPASLTTDEVGNVTVSFTTINTLESDGKIVVTFPTTL